MKKNRRSLWLVGASLFLVGAMLSSCVSIFQTSYFDTICVEAKKTFFKRLTQVDYDKPKQQYTFTSENFEVNYNQEVVVDFGEVLPATSYNKMAINVRNTKNTDDVYYFSANYSGEAVFDTWSIAWDYLIKIGVQYREIYETYAVAGWAKKTCSRCN